MTTTSHHRPHQRRDGFSRIELLLVLVVLGILATIVTTSVTGLTAQAEDAGCDTEARILQTAAEAYLTTFDGTIPPSGPDTPDAFERTLVEGHYLRRVSALYDIDADGQLAAAPDSPCQA